MVFKTTGSILTGQFIKRIGLKIAINPNTREKKGLVVLLMVN
jgi:hypothetical protein